MARREFGPARALLEEALKRRPGFLPLLVTLSHALLRAGWFRRRNDEGAAVRAAVADNRGQSGSPLNSQS
jgi:hypothetical protein